MALVQPTVSNTSQRVVSLEKLGKAIQRPERLQHVSIPQPTTLTVASSPPFSFNLGQDTPASGEPAKGGNEDDRRERLTDSLNHDSGLAIKEARV